MPVTYLPIFYLFLPSWVSSKNRMSHVQCHGRAWKNKRIYNPLDWNKTLGGGRERVSNYPKKRIRASKRWLKLRRWYWLEISHHLNTPACPPTLNSAEPISWAALVFDITAGADDNEGASASEVAEHVILQKTNMNDASSFLKKFWSPVCPPLLMKEATEPQKAKIVSTGSRIRTT